LFWKSFNCSLSSSFAFKRALKNIWKISVIKFHSNTWSNLQRWEPSGILRGVVSEQTNISQVHTASITRVINNGGSMHLSNVDLLQWNYMVQYPRRLFIFILITIRTSNLMKESSTPQPLSTNTIKVKTQRKCLTENGVYSMSRTEKLN
jgi:hypothetical protein